MKIFESLYAGIIREGVEDIGSSWESKWFLRKMNEPLKKINVKKNSVSMWCRLLLFYLFWVNLQLTKLLWMGFIMTVPSGGTPFREVTGVQRAPLTQNNHYNKIADIGTASPELLHHQHKVVNSDSSSYRKYGRKST